MFVRADVTIEKPELAVLDQAIGIFETDFAGTDRLDLRTRQDDSGLVFFEQEIVVSGVPVGSGIPFTTGSWLSARLLLSTGLRLVSGLPRHV